MANVKIELDVFTRDERLFKSKIKMFEVWAKPEIAHTEELLKQIGELKLKIDSIKICLLITSEGPTIINPNASWGFSKRLRFYEANCVINVAECRSDTESSKNFFIAELRSFLNVVLERILKYFRLSGIDCSPGLLRKQSGSEGSGIVVRELP